MWAPRQWWTEEKRRWLISCTLVSDYRFVKGQLDMIFNIHFHQCITAEYALKHLPPLAVWCGCAWPVKSWSKELETKSHCELRSQRFPNDKVSKKNFPLKGTFAQVPLADHLQAEAEVSAQSVMSHSPTMPIIVQISRLYLERNKGAEVKEFPRPRMLCLCSNASLSLRICFNICIHKSRACVHHLCVRVRPLPRSIQLLFRDGRQMCCDEGAGSSVRKHLFDSRSLWFPFFFLLPGV